MTPKLIYTIAEVSNIDYQVADFAARQIECLPTILRFGVMVLSFLFLTHARLVGLQAFSQQSSSKRIALINRWRHSKISICRDFILLYDSLFALASHATLHANTASTGEPC